MKNILVIGANGMLGYAVTEYYLLKEYNVKPLTINEFDITKDPMEKLESFLENIEVVINCAGIIKPLISKFSIEYILRVNSIFPRNLAKVCNKNDILCFHITTDCVYSGKKGNYNENDYFDATDIYGMTKNSGDINDYMTLRTSIIGEEKGQGRSLLEWARGQAGREVNGFINHYWNGITTLYFAEIIETILKKDLYSKGIFHIFSKEIVCKFELLEMINEIYDLKIIINKVETTELCDRSLSSEEDLCKNIVRKSLRKQIEEMKSFFNLRNEKKE